MLCTSDIYTLINYVGFVNYLFYGVTVAGLIVLRVQQPSMHRPIKVRADKFHSWVVPSYILGTSSKSGFILQISLVWPVLYLLFWTFLMVFSLYSGPLVCGVGLVIMVTGVPVYFLGVYWENKPRCFISTMSKAASWLCIRNNKSQQATLSLFELDVIFGKKSLCVCRKTDSSVPKAVFCGLPSHGGEPRAWPAKLLTQSWLLMAAEMKMDSSCVACFECGNEWYMMSMHMGYLYNHLAEAITKVCSFKLLFSPTSFCLKLSGLFNLNFYSYLGNCSQLHIYSSNCGFPSRCFCSLTYF